MTDTVLLNLAAAIHANNGAISGLHSLATEGIGSCGCEFAGGDSALEEDIHFGECLALGLAVGYMISDCI